MSGGAPAAVDRLVPCVQTWSPAPSRLRWSARAYLLGDDDRDAWRFEARNGPNPSEGDPDRCEDLGHLGIGFRDKLKSRAPMLL